MYFYSSYVCVCIHMFIQKSSVCMDKYTYMRALCREVQREGSVIYMYLYIVYVNVYIPLMYTDIGIIGELCICG